MEKLVIVGGCRLRGTVAVNGAKNAALPLMAAALLTEEECVLENVPMVEDVRTMALLLAHLGCAVELDEAAHRVVIRAATLRTTDLPVALARRMRASFLLTGPLLARCGQARAPHPGGCAIGRRPVNVDIKGFQAMGAEVTLNEGLYSLRAPRLVGQKIYLDYPSHTGTENLLMAACLAEGRTVIKHASAEPEVVALAEALVQMGARIHGAGSSLIEVEGVSRLRGVRLTVLPDRLEAGTFAIAAALTGGDVVIENVCPAHMDPLTHKLLEVGAQVEEGPTWYRVTARGPLRAVELQTLPYPGFPTDLQAAFAVLLTQAVGTSLVHERVFDDRLQYTAELRKLGARISVQGQTATIEGPTPLRGAPVRALDIRSGAALILAGLVAEGVTEVLDIHHVDRGYEALDRKLARLGASIWRVPVETPAATVLASGTPLS